MKKTYYVEEYSPKQWVALINKAVELGCALSYNKYGRMCEIDSTEVEDRILSQTGKNEQNRMAWAERIHELIQEASNIVRYIVRRGAFRSKVFKNLKDAENYCNLMNWQTGQDIYTIEIMNPDKK